MAWYSYKRQFFILLAQNLSSTYHLTTILIRNKMDPSGAWRKCLAAEGHRGERTRRRDRAEEGQSGGKTQRGRDSGEETAGERQTKGHSGGSSRRDSGYTSRKKGITAEDTAAEGHCGEEHGRRTAPGCRREGGGTATEHHRVIRWRKDTAEGA